MKTHTYLLPRSRTSLQIAFSPIQENSWYRASKDRIYPAFILSAAKTTWILRLVISPPLKTDPQENTNSKQLSVPNMPPPAYIEPPFHHSHSHTPSHDSFEQMLQHIPTPQPQKLCPPSPGESKWARRSAEIEESKWASPRNSSSPWLQDEPWTYTESKRDYRRESKKKFILFVVAILIMLAVMLAVVGATTHFKIGRSCNMELINGSWVCF